MSKKDKRIATLEGVTATQRWALQQGDEQIHGLEASLATLRDITVPNMVRRIMNQRRELRRVHQQNTLLRRQVESLTAQVELSHQLREVALRPVSRHRWARWMVG